MKSIPFQTKKAKTRHTFISAESSSWCPQMLELVSRPRGISEGLQPAKREVLGVLTLLQIPATKSPHSFPQDRWFGPVECFFLEEKTPIYPQEPGPVQTQIQAKSTKSTWVPWIQTQESLQTAKDAPLQTPSLPEKGRRCQGSTTKNAPGQAGRLPYQKGVCPNKGLTCAARLF